MSINEIKVFIFENCYKRIGFDKNISYNSMKHLYQKDLFLLANKLIKNIVDPINTKKHYKSFTIKENRESVKQSEIITYQSRSLKNPDNVNKKSFITEHPKTSYKLSKIIRQAENVGSDSFLNKDTVKSEHFLNEKI